MPNETLTKRQATAIVATFIMGSLVMMNLSPEAEQDTWISLLMAAAAFMLIALVYARVMQLYPGKDIFQIICALFGKAVAKALILLLFWYSAHLLSLVIRNFSEFVEIIAMPETPQLPIMLIMMLLSAYLAKSGAESLGKWAVAVLPLVSLVIVADTLLSFNKMDFSNVQPIFAYDLGALSSGAFSLFTFPFAEAVLFMGLANNIKKTDSPRRIYALGIIIAAAAMLLIMLRNIELLGVPLMKAEYFPSYMAVRVINIGNVITRIEGSVSMNYILLGFTKGTVCLLFAAKGAAALFGASDYKKLVIPVGVFSVALASIIYKNTMEMFGFIKVYAYYAVPFQIAIPLIIWITAEAKNRKSNAGAS